MKIIYHAILDGKLEITHRDGTRTIIDDIVPTAITHDVDRHGLVAYIKVARLSQHQNVTRPYDVWRLRYNYTNANTVYVWKGKERTGNYK